MTPGRIALAPRAVSASAIAYSSGGKMAPAVESTKASSAVSSIRLVSSPFARLGRELQVNGLLQLQGRRKPIKVRRGVAEFNPRRFQANHLDEVVADFE